MNRTPICHLRIGKMSESHHPVHALKRRLVDENRYASVAFLVKFLNSFEKAKKRLPHLILSQIEKRYIVYYSRYALPLSTNLIRS